MASIAAAARRFKSNPAIRLPDEWVDEACRLADHGWRDRIFTPAVTLQVFMNQILHGNCGCREALRISGVKGSTSAYCEARRRLPQDVLGYVTAELLSRAKKQSDADERWRGHRVLMLDGSGISMPDTEELREAYHLPGGVKPGCGFPVMHTLWLTDMNSGLIRDFTTAPWNTHEMRNACRLHGNLEAGDVVVGDRAFGVFSHLAVLKQQDLHGLCRLKQGTIVSFKPGRPSAWSVPKAKRKGYPRSDFVRRLGDQDQIVRYRKPRLVPKWMSPQDYDELPETIELREIRYRVRRRGHRTREVTLVTTLLDAERYPKRALEELYQMRWRIETDLLMLKQTLGLDVLRCKTKAGVQKELWACVLVYNLIREVMMEAAKRQGVSPRRVSFKDVVDVIRHTPELYQELQMMINPWRPGRDEPRVIKRRKDRYRHMTRPRDTLRQELGITGDAA